jgi:hypothetical protein
MKIIVNNQEFETNPSGLNTSLLFMGTVHTGTSIQENVYGFSAEQIISFARQLKEANNDFNTVHVYGPCGSGSSREHVGTYFL